MQTLAVNSVYLWLRTHVKWGGKDFDLYFIHNEIVRYRLLIRTFIRATFTAGAGSKKKRRDLRDIYNQLMEIQKEAKRDKNAAYPLEYLRRHYHHKAGKFFFWNLLTGKIKKSTNIGDYFRPPMKGVITKT